MTDQRPLSPRTLTIIAAAKADPQRTLNNIGIEFNITRERVRQHLLKGGLVKRLGQPTAKKDDLP